MAIPITCCCLLPCILGPGLAPMNFTSSDGDFTTDFEPWVTENFEIIRMNERACEGIVDPEEAGFLCSTLSGYAEDDTDLLR